MGLFDYIICLYPLPEVTFNLVFGEPFQTKSFECMMDTYTITSDGLIIYHKTRSEIVPKKERPYYGKPEWKTSSVARICGMYRTLPVADVYLDLTDTITFYTFNGDEWFEFAATFVDGVIRDIRRIRR